MRVVSTLPRGEERTALGDGVQMDHENATYLFFEPIRSSLPFWICVCDVHPPRDSFKCDTHATISVCIAKPFLFFSFLFKYLIYSVWLVQCKF